MRGDDLILSSFSAYFFWFSSAGGKNHITTSHTYINKEGGGVLQVQAQRRRNS